MSNPDAPTTTQQIKEVLISLKSTFSKFISSIENAKDEAKPNTIMSAIIQVAEQAHIQLLAVSITDFVKEIVVGEEEFINLLKSSNIGDKFFEAVSSLDFFLDGNEEDLKNYIDAHINRATPSCC